MKRFDINVRSATDARFIVKVKDVRISILTPCIVRVERGNFCDEPTQRVWYRAFDEPSFKCDIKGNTVTVTTDKASFVYSVSRHKMLRIILSDGRKVTNFSKGNLLGTRRTLDGCDGKVRLEKGLVSRGGVSVLDDSDGLILRGDKIVSRPACKDMYYFAYGSDYRGCIADLFRLCGQVPLIPRFALGNWWSRYKAYTQEEYSALMDRFTAEDIPVTVATIDMDWHWVDVVGKFGDEARPVPSKNFLDMLYSAWFPGWTGYSWNTDLFPDYKALLKRLHEQGYFVTLNIHPSTGIRFFEDMYEQVCRTVGKDPSKKEPVKFRLGDEKFLQAYFDDVHRPYERDGVDFWWIDWQQGKWSDIPGLDPLWAVNHYHFLDQKDQGKRPLILSRYAGIGSHRYPLGFSGDYSMTWQSLRFQPYMTSTATNAGYTWWSHDIGGHHKGYKDDELYLRWLQFGVFSPVNRLHSTSNEFMGKEPWKCDKATEIFAKKFMRLRHRLIPYIYSENYITHTKGRALCEPMYYAYDCDEAYAVKNEYMFGSQLLVSPITEHTDRRTGLAGADLWIPEGRYTDIFTSDVYTAGKYRVYRDMDKMPVFAKEGAIIPLYHNESGNSIDIDQPLDIWIYRGDGEYVLYEDDGCTMDYEKGKYVTTHMLVNTEGDSMTFTVVPEGGDVSLLPKGRKFFLEFRSLISAQSVEINGKKRKEGLDGLYIVYEGEPVTVTVKGCVYAENAGYKERVIDLISKFRMNNMRKAAKFNKMLSRNTAISKSAWYSGPVNELRAICSEDKK